MNLFVDKVAFSLFECVVISCIYCCSCYIKLDKSDRNNYLNFKFAITKKNIKSGVLKCLF